MSTRYSRIDPEKMKFDRKNRYSGIWNGKEVSFSRIFRGHYLVDAECVELCRGRQIEIHNLQGRYGLYAVRCQLQETIIGTDRFVSVTGCDTIPNRKDYDSRTLHRVDTSDKDIGHDIDFDDDDLEGIYFEETGDVLAREKAKYEAALSESRYRQDHPDDTVIDEDYEDHNDEEPEEQSGLIDDMADGDFDSTDFDDDG